MQLNNVEIVDTYAEAFSAYASRVLITAADPYWAKQAAISATGFATSMIDCPCEAGIEAEVSADQTPDGRPGVIVMFFGNKDTIAKVVMERIGQCVLTCPTTAAFDAYPSDLVNEKTIEAPAGKNLAFFGDGFQEKDEQAFPFLVHRIPVMDGQFVVQSIFMCGKAIAGGNLILQASSPEAALAAVKAAVEAALQCGQVIMPFPGGVARSGSKVGSLKYSFLKASTNEKLCPTLKPAVEDSLVMEGVTTVLELVFDGLTEDAITQAMRAAIKAAVDVEGVVCITAGNYEGKLGKHNFYLKDLI
jgi:formylmethanofuran--tetrahydromethanopterin N-formyltransferase